MIGLEIVGCTLTIMFGFGVLLFLLIIVSGFGGK